MTVIKFFSTDRGIIGFSAKGHTGFAYHGEDIVCSAVSVLTQTAVIGFREVLKLDISIRIKNGYLKCELPNIESNELWKQCQLIMNVLYSGLQAVLKEYGEEYLRIEEVELCK